MPPVKMTICSDCSTYGRQLAEKVLPEVISESLTYPGKIEVSPGSVMIDVQKRDPIMSVNMPDILIEVEAHSHPARVGNEDEMALEIKEAADAFLEKRSRQPTIIVIIKLMVMGVAAPIKQKVPAE